MKSNVALRPKSRWFQGMPGLSLLALILLPKCPMCLGAYLGFLTVLGVSSLTAAKWMVAILCVAGASVLVKLYHTGRQRDSLLPFWISLAGFSAIALERFWWESGPLKWLGLLLFCLGCLPDLVRMDKFSTSCAVKLQPKTQPSGDHYEPKR